MTREEAIKAYTPKPGEKIVGYTEKYIKVMDVNGKIKHRRPKINDIKEVTNYKGNAPQNKMAVIEEDEKKRSFMAKTLKNCYSFFKMGLSPIKSNEELIERLDFFFTQCEETQQIPTIEKMALVLGYTTVTLNNLTYETDKAPKWVTPETGHIIKKAKQTIAAMDADLVQEGKIQPVVWMFRAKNYYGMRDQQEIVVTPGAENTYNPDDLVAEAKMLAESNNKAEKKRMMAVEVEAHDEE